MKLQRPVNTGILVVDYGSQYTLLIARRLREIGTYAEVVGGQCQTPPEGFDFQGIILSGGPDSVTSEGARSLAPWIIDSKKPVLGICYGMQLLVNEFGGSLQSGSRREYGKSQMKLNSEMNARAAKIFYGLETEQQVWMSHGDDVKNLPPCFESIALTTDGVEAAIAHKELPIVGLQFHPEVQHTQCGKVLLQNFVKDLCLQSSNWQADDMMSSTSNYIKETVGNGKVLMAVSGGVDSTVAAVMMAKVLGPDKVTAVFVDHGLLRKHECGWVSDNLKLLGIKNLNVIDAKETFLNKLKGVIDPEEKRKIIGNTFIEIFEEFAERSNDFTHLGQGTLYPDVIESAGDGDGAKVIKSHHNVGGLPEKLKLTLVEPFRFLFKDEVRTLGLELGISKELINRHPFPGPGLAIRILGEVNPVDLDLLKEADHIFIQALKDKGLYDHTWQAFAVLLPIRSVGVMGDNRTYEKTCALRAVTASDGMTAGVSDLSMEFLTSVSDQIIRKISGINRVVYDISTKPPATIEWE